MATSSEVSIYKNLSKADKADIILELAAFMDGGLFWDREKNDALELNNYFTKRALVDGGVGLRLKTDIFEKDLYLRIDLPFFIHNKGKTSIDKKNWIISFQRSI